MRRGTWVMYCVFHAVWWTWVIAWGVLYVFWLFTRWPEWYAMLLAINAFAGAIMIRSWRKMRQLRLDYIRRQATLEEDLRVAIEQGDDMKIALTADLMRIWKMDVPESVRDRGLW